MSNEEAISELETIKRVYANMRKEYKPCVEALQMAVDLLKQADTPQTERTCENCGTPRDKCVYCIEEDRMWTPQTDIHGLTDCDFCKGEDCEDCEGDKDEPQIFTWGKEVHEFCKMKCNKSKARLFDGDRFIVCGQSNDSICINLPACPLSKWITGKGYHILPMDEPQTGGD